MVNGARQPRIKMFFPYFIQWMYNGRYNVNNILGCYSTVMLFCFLLYFYVLLLLLFLLYFLFCVCTFSSSVMCLFFIKVISCSLWYWKKVLCNLICQCNPSPHIFVFLCMGLKPVFYLTVYTKSNYQHYRVNG